MSKIKDKLEENKKIKEITGTKDSKELESKLKSKLYDIKGIYQYNDKPQWKEWNDLKENGKGKDTWLFFGCSEEKIEDILENGEIVNNSDFFPPIFGKDAFYLSNSSEFAARMGRKFLLNKGSEGLVFSFRTLPGKLYKAKEVAPELTEAPKGYDSILAPKGFDLGIGKSWFDLLVGFDKERFLLRYITHYKVS